MLRRILIISGVIFGSFITSCYYDVEDELYPLPGGGVLPETVSYQDHVNPILINSSCYICHFSGNVAGSGIELEGYASLKSYIDGESSTFLCAIKHESCASAMPKGGGKISAYDISLVEKWINQGYPDN